jgi:hypothetical protein
MQRRLRDGVRERAPARDDARDRRASSSRETSPCSYTASGSERASASPASTERDELTITLAPSPANRSATARPIPLDDPVTRTTSLTGRSYVPAAEVTCGRRDPPPFSGKLRGHHAAPSGVVLPPRCAGFDSVRSLRRPLERDPPRIAQPRTFSSPRSVSRCGRRPDNRWRRLRCSGRAHALEFGRLAGVNRGSTVRSSRLAPAD